MLTLAVLLILAVLLFGSSAVLGALGMVLGAIVALIAMVWASINYQISSETWVLVGIGFIALIGITHYALLAKERAEDAKNPLAAEARRKVRADIEARTKALRER